MIRRLLVPTSAALATAAIVASLAVAAGLHASSDAKSSYAVGLWGDMPYSDEQQSVGVPNLIADMNAQGLAFSVHDGDLKRGGTPCTDDVYTQAKAMLDSLDAPAAFTPGDNDWTDCDATAGYSSLERLDHERAVFFSTDTTLGQNQLTQKVQATPACLGVDGPTPCVENRMWVYRGVVYATLNIQGSCNNLCGEAPDPAEYAARNDADIAWMRRAFATATKRDAAAVMLISQADPGWDESDVTRAPLRDPETLVETGDSQDGYRSFLLALRDQVIAFRRPVAYVNGDSHYLRIDKPFQDDQGRRLENFTRVETFGDHEKNGNNDVNWLKVEVDPGSREVFAFQPQIVPANRVAVPAP